ncbi:hypothetical protein [Actinomycetospora soli]|uniref:hypothetical protein n=1 Tax=Actinomycetospora soli TaxID=2893887 RepID=UPI001E45F785|nr:hypothetical protein [Actinomycetospora soli]MCD2187633.1 hypothetical protein [Actinomycetospora soli]
MFELVIVLVALAAVAALVSRYGADSRLNDTADHRDPALPRGPQYRHTPVSDLRLVAAFARRVAAQRQAWAAYDRSLRPWETQRSSVRPVG